MGFELASFSTESERHSTEADGMPFPDDLASQSYIVLFKRFTPSRQIEPLFAIAVGK